MHKVSVAPARRAALRALARVRRTDAFSGPVLAAELSSASLSPGDAALTTRLVYGVLAAQGTLDEALGRHVRTSLEPRVRDALRLGVFELIFNRAPAYAVVDQAVEAVRAIRPQAAGMANAVMRRLADESTDFPWGDPLTDCDALAREHAHPRWIVDVVLESLGERNGLEMLACGLEPAPTYVRLNPFAHDRASVLESLGGAGPEPAPPDPDCLHLTVPSAAFDTGHDETAWFPMDAAAQMTPRVCAPDPGMRILDVGAGRGNKTICLQAIALRSGGPAAITAIDVHEGKSEALRARLDAAQVPGVSVLTADALALRTQFGPDAFDLVLLDAPCSGLGTLRRYPEKRWRLDPGDPARMAELQARLLDAAAAVTRPGGRVVYSTCSVDRRENSDVVEAFLASDSGNGWIMETLDGVIPAEWAAFRDERGCFQSWPTSGGPDGHYVASLRRADV